MTRPVVVLLGQPGSGKGTQASFFEDRLAAHVLGIGDSLRKEVEDRTSLGEEVKSVLSSGLLLPDTLIQKVIHRTLRKHSGNGLVVLDGFVRSVPQAQFLKTFLEDKRHRFALVAVFYLQVQEELLVKRLLGRFICATCRSSQAASQECARCQGTDFIRREDDVLEVILKRIQVNKENDRGILDFYKELNVVHIKNAEQSQEELFEDILNTLRTLVNKTAFSHVLGLTKGF